MYIHTHTHAHAHADIIALEQALRRDVTGAFHLTGALHAAASAEPRLGKSKRPVASGSDSVCLTGKAILPASACESLEGMRSQNCEKLAG